jgi:hypothetical protein
MTEREREREIEKINAKKFLSLSFSLPLSLVCCFTRLKGLFPNINFKRDKRGERNRAAHSFRKTRSGIFDDEYVL